MLAAWLCIAALAQSNEPAPPAEVTTAQAPTTAEPANIPSPAPALPDTAATDAKPGDLWEPALTRLTATLGPATVLTDGTQCWLLHKTADRCHYWHAVPGTRADLTPGGDSTPVVRFAGEGRATGPSATHPPCCATP